MKQVEFVIEVQRQDGSWSWQYSAPNESESKTQFKRFTTDAPGYCWRMKRRETTIKETVVRESK